MKYGINRITLMGNIGEMPRRIEKDGEIVFVTFPLATSEVYTNKAGEEIQETTWHRIKLRNGMAKHYADKLSKGDPVFLEGKQTHTHFDNSDGERHYVSEVLVNTLRKLERNSHG